MCPSQESYVSSDWPLSYVVNGGRQNLWRSDALNRDWFENGVFPDKGCTHYTSSPRAAPVTECSLASITKYDGTTNTIMLAENRDAGPWCRARFAYLGELDSQILWFPTLTPTLNLNADDPALPATSPNRARPSSEHPGGFNVAMCGGSVRRMNEEMQYKVYALLMTPRGTRAQNPDGNTCPPSGTNRYPCPDWQADVLPSF